MPKDNIDILNKNTSLLKKLLTIIWAFTEAIIFATEGVNIVRVIKMWHRHEVSKRCWKDGAKTLAGSKVD